MPMCFWAVFCMPLGSQRPCASSPSTAAARTTPFPFPLKRLSPWKAGEMLPQPAGKWNPSYAGNTPWRMELFPSVCSPVIAHQCAPNGVQEMSREVEGLVQTSLNLGILATYGEEVRATFCVRSNINSQKEMLLHRLELLCGALGGTFLVSGTYPAWEYRADSPLRCLMAEVFAEQYGHTPTVEVIHAGVECGLLADKLPGLDCVSIGPDLTEIHTPRERMHVASVRRTWALLTETLRRIR